MAKGGGDMEERSTVLISQGSCASERIFWKVLEEWRVSILGCPKEVFWLGIVYLHRHGYPLILSLLSFPRKIFLSCFFLKSPCVKLKTVNGLVFRSDASNWIYYLFGKTFWCFCLKSFPFNFKKCWAGPTSVIQGSFLCETHQRERFKSTLDCNFLKA